MAVPQDLNAESFRGEVTAAPGAVLVDFWSQNCSHCREFNPLFEEAAEKGREGVSFAKVSVQDALDLFREHRVHAVPTLVLFRDGVEVARQPGSRPAGEVLAWLDAQL